MTPSNTLGIAARRERTATLDPTTTPKRNDYTAALAGLYVRPGTVPNSAIAARISNRNTGLHQARRAVPEPLHANPGMANPARTIAGPLRPASFSHLGRREESSPPPPAAIPLTPAEAKVSAALPAPRYIPAPPLDEEAASLAKSSQRTLVSEAQSRLQKNDVTGAQKAISLENILHGKRPGHVIVLADEQEAVSVALQFLAANRAYILKNKEKFVFVSESLSPNPSKGYVEEQRAFLPEFLLDSNLQIDGMDMSGGAQLANRYAEIIAGLRSLRKEIEGKMKPPGHRNAAASDQDVAKLKASFTEVKNALRKDLALGTLTGASKKEAQKLLRYMKRSLGGEDFTLATLYTAIDGSRGPVTRLRNIITEFRRGENRNATDQQAVAQHLQQLAGASGKFVIYLSDPQKIFDVQLQSKDGSDDAKADKKKYAFRQGFLGHLAASTNSQCTTLVFGQSEDTDFAFKPIELGRIIGGEEYKGISTASTISVPGKLFTKGWAPNARSSDSNSSKGGSPDGRSESSEDSE